MISLPHFIERLRIRSFKRFQEFTTNYPGFKCRVIDKSSFLYMYDEIMTRGIYQFKTTNPKPVIIDCGANIGLSTIYFKQLYPEAKVTAFEPDPYIFSVLKDNLTASGTADNVTCIQACLTKEPGPVTFYSDHADGGSMQTSATASNSLTVPGVSLRSYLTEKVDFLKIDIEGAESEVISSIKDLLTNVQNIFVEYHSFCNKPQSLNEIINALTRAGFRYYIEPGGSHSQQPFIKTESYAGMDMQLNIFGYRDN